MRSNRVLFNITYEANCQHSQRILNIRNANQIKTLQICQVLALQLDESKQNIDLNIELT